MSLFWCKTKTFNIGGTGHTKLNDLVGDFFFNRDREKEAERDTTKKISS